mmetsp:Transcript_11979/g.32961  ORF Transcript_11979/g.32961 Transcript_11979/m.32961 type:complete len:120 (-) Transcript_11979:67-426(-)
MDHHKCAVCHWTEWWQKWLWMRIFDVKQDLCDARLFVPSSPESADEQERTNREHRLEEASALLPRSSSVDHWTSGANVWLVSSELPLESVPTASGTQLPKRCCQHPLCAAYPYACEEDR